MLFFLIFFEVISSFSMFCVTNVDPEDLENHAMYKLSHETVLPYLSKIINANYENSLIAIRSQKKKKSNGLLEDILIELLSILRSQFEHKFHNFSTYVQIDDILAQSISNNIKKANIEYLSPRNSHIKEISACLLKLKNDIQVKKLIAIAVVNEIEIILKPHFNNQIFNFYAHFYASIPEKGLDFQFEMNSELYCGIIKENMFDFTLKNSHQRLQRELKSNEMKTIVVFHVFDFQRLFHGVFMNLYRKLPDEKAGSLVEVLRCLNDSKNICFKILENDLQPGKQYYNFVKTCWNKKVKMIHNYQECQSMWNRSSKKILFRYIKYFCPNSLVFAFIDDFITNMCTNFNHFFKIRCNYNFITCSFLKAKRSGIFQKNILENCKRSFFQIKKYVELIESDLIIHENVFFSLVDEVYAVRKIEEFKRFKEEKLWKSQRPDKIALPKQRCSQSVVLSKDIIPDTTCDFDCDAFRETHKNISFPELVKNKQLKSVMPIESDNSQLENELGKFDRSKILERKISCVSKYDENDSTSQSTCDSTKYSADHKIFEAHKHDGTSLNSTTTNIIYGDHKQDENVVTNQNSSDSSQSCYESTDYLATFLGNFVITQSKIEPPQTQEVHQQEKDSSVTFELPKDINKDSKLVKNIIKALSMEPAHVNSNARNKEKLGQLFDLSKKTKNTIINDLDRKNASDNYQQDPLSPYKNVSMDFVESCNQRKHKKIHSTKSFQSSRISRLLKLKSKFTFNELQKYTTSVSKLTEIKNMSDELRLKTLQLLKSESIFLLSSDKSLLEDIFTKTDSVNRKVLELVTQLNEYIDCLSETKLITEKGILDQSGDSKSAQQHGKILQKDICSKKSKNVKILGSLNPDFEVYKNKEGSIYPKPADFNYKTTDDLPSFRKVESKNPLVAFKISDLEFTIKNFDMILKKSQTQDNFGFVNCECEKCCEYISPCVQRFEHIYDHLCTDKYDLLKKEAENSEFEPRVQRHFKKSLNWKQESRWLLEKDFENTFFKDFLYETTEKYCLYALFEHDSEIASTLTSYDSKDTDNFTSADSEGFISNDLEIQKFFAPNESECGSDGLLLDQSDAKTSNQFVGIRKSNLQLADKIPGLDSPSEEKPCTTSSSIMNNAVFFEEAEAQIQKLAHKKDSKFLKKTNDEIEKIFSNAETFFSLIGIDKKEEVRFFKFILKKIDIENKKTSALRKDDTSLAESFFKEFYKILKIKNEQIASIYSRLEFIWGKIEKVLKHTTFDDAFKDFSHHRREMEGILESDSYRQNSFCDDVDCASNTPNKPIKDDEIKKAKKKEKKARQKAKKEAIKYGFNQIPTSDEFLKNEILPQQCSIDDLRSESIANDSTILDQVGVNYSDSTEKTDRGDLEYTQDNNNYTDTEIKSQLLVSKSISGDSDPHLLQISKKSDIIKSENGFGFNSRVDFSVEYCMKMPDTQKCENKSSLFGTLNSSTQQFQAQKHDKLNVDGTISTFGNEHNLVFNNSEIELENPSAVNTAFGAYNTRSDFENTDKHENIFLLENIQKTEINSISTDYPESDKQSFKNICNLSDLKESKKNLCDNPINRFSKTLKMGSKESQTKNCSRKHQVVTTQILSSDKKADNFIHSSKKRLKSSKQKRGEFNHTYTDGLELGFTSHAEILQKKPFEKSKNASVILDKSFIDSQCQSDNTQNLKNHTFTQKIQPKVHKPISFKATNHKISDSSKKVKNHAKNSNQVTQPSIEFKNFSFDQIYSYEKQKCFNSENTHKNVTYFEIPSKDHYEPGDFNEDIDVISSGSFLQKLSYSQIVKQKALKQNISRSSDIPSPSKGPVREYSPGFESLGEINITKRPRIDVSHPKIRILGLDNDIHSLENSFSGGLNISTLDDPLQVGQKLQESPPCVNKITLNHQTIFNDLGNPKSSRNSPNSLSNQSNFQNQDELTNIFNKYLGNQSQTRIHNYEFTASQIQENVPITNRVAKTNIEDIYCRSKSNDGFAYLFFSSDTDVVLGTCQVSANFQQLKSAFENRQNKNTNESKNIDRIVEILGNSDEFSPNDIMELINARECDHGSLDEIWEKCLVFENQSLKKHQSSSNLSDFGNIFDLKGYNSPEKSYSFCKYGRIPSSYFNIDEHPQFIPCDPINRDKNDGCITQSSLHSLKTQIFQTNKTTIENTSQSVNHFKNSSHKAAINQKNYVLRNDGPGEVLYDGFQVDSERYTTFSTKKLFYHSHPQPSGLFHASENMRIGFHELQENPVNFSCYCSKRFHDLHSETEHHSNSFLYYSDTPNTDNLHEHNNAINISAQNKLYGESFSSGHNFSHSQNFEFGYQEFNNFKITENYRNQNYMITQPPPEAHSWTLQNQNKHDSCIYFPFYST